MREFKAALAQAVIRGFHRSLAPMMARANLLEIERRLIPLKHRLQIEEKRASGRQAVG